MNKWTEMLRTIVHHVVKTHVNQSNSAFICVYLLVFFIVSTVCCIAIIFLFTACTLVMCFNLLLLLLLVCVSFTIIGQPRNSVLIRRV